MTNTPDPITTAQADRMVGAIDPDCTVVEATPMTGGHHPVATVVVERGSDRTRYVLKATAEDGAPTAATEVRLLRVLAAETSLPVPALLGAVDEHSALPAPFFLMERLPGRKLPRTELGRADHDRLEQLARSAGRQLATLHRFDAFDAFGRVTHRGDRPLAGGVPPATPDQLTLDDPAARWPGVLERWVDQALSGLESTRFDDLVPALRDTMATRLDELDGRFEPVLAHIDWSLDNLLFDPETNAVSGLPDWEFTVVASRGYDLVYAAHSLAGGPWTFVPDYPDVRDRVRESLVAGYRERAPAGALEDYRAHRGTYELLNTMHAMLHTADRLALDGADAEQRSAAMANLRAHAETFR